MACLCMGVCSSGAISSSVSCGSEIALGPPLHPNGQRARAFHISALRDVGIVVKTYKRKQGGGTAERWGARESARERGHTHSQAKYRTCSSKQEDAAILWAYGPVASRFAAHDAATSHSGPRSVRLRDEKRARHAAGVRNHPHRLRPAGGRGPLRQAQFPPAL